VKARVRPERDRERTSTETRRKDEHSVTKIALNVQKSREEKRDFVLGTRVSST
jgi:hypothetical protein